MTVLKQKKPLLRHSSLKRTRHTAAETNPSRKADAADVLWSLLRDQDVAGLRFKRQQAIGPHVADFVCPSAKLILKLERLRPTDSAELQWFRDNGYRVLQFQETEVVADPQRVLDAIERVFAFRLIARNS